ncbi:MAG: hypothetical protein ISR69_07030 [Gammaproteobacteria bacterium]|nr:hypothetical protein [Gammaproteobacteria bacterium]
MKTKARIKILSAGDSGVYLYPFVKNISKQLMPIYDNLIIFFLGDFPRFEQLFGDDKKINTNWILSEDSPIASFKNQSNNQPLEEVLRRSNLEATILLHK